jgi:hypothetical protein
LRQKEIRDEVEKEATNIVKAAEIQIEKEAKQDEINKGSLSEGVIDLVSKNLAIRDKANKEHRESTATIAALVRTKAAASGAASEATRDSLSSGIEATRDPSPYDLKKELE